MTQLLLFDGNHSLIASSVASEQMTPKTSISVQPTSPKPSGPESVDGVKPMGDLARAVLMRYEMMARRREIIQKRREQALLADRQARPNPTTERLAKAK